MSTDPIFKDVPRSILARMFWRPWAKTESVRDHDAEFSRACVLVDKTWRPSSVSASTLGMARAQRNACIAPAPSCVSPSYDNSEISNPASMFGLVSSGHVAAPPAAYVSGGGGDFGGGGASASCDSSTSSSSSSYSGSDSGSSSSSSDSSSSSSSSSD